MGSITIFILLTALCAAGCIVLWNVKSEDILPGILCGSAVFLYFWYCADLLRFGTMILLCVWGSIFLAGLIKILRFNREQRKSMMLRCAAIGSYLLLALLCILLSCGKQVCSWDAARLWAAVPKILHFIGTRQTGADAVIFPGMQSYYPGMPLFVYLTAFFSGEFYEETIFAAYALFGGTLLLRIFSGCRPVDAARTVILRLAVILLLPMAFYMNGGDSAYYYGSLFIDPVLGILSGMLMLRACEDNVWARGERETFLAELAMLVILKDTGLLFAVMVLITAAIRAPSLRDALRRSILPVVCVLISWLVWRLVLHCTDVHSLYSIDLLHLNWAYFPQLMDALISVSMLPWPDRLSSLPAPSMAVCTAGLLVIDGLVCYYRGERNCRRWFAVRGIWLLTTGSFIIGYYALYGETLESFQRYMGTPLTCYSTFLALRLFKCNRKNIFVAGKVPARMQHIHLIPSIMTAVILTAGFALYNNRIYSWYAVNREPDAAAQVLASAIKKDVGENDIDSQKVYLVMDNVEFDHHRIYFDLLGSGIYVGNYYDESVLPNQWTQTPEQFLQHLAENDYDYVYVYHAAGIDETFESIFTESYTQYALYRVETENGKDAVLISIPAASSEVYS